MALTSQQLYDCWPEPMALRVHGSAIGIAFGPENVFRALEFLQVPQQCDDCGAVGKNVRPYDYDYKGERTQCIACRIERLERDAFGPQS